MLSTRRMILVGTSKYLQEESSKGVRRSPLPLDFIRVDMGCKLVRAIDVTKIMTNGDTGPLVFGS